MTYLDHIDYIGENGTFMTLGTLTTTQTTGNTSTSPGYGTKPAVFNLDDQSSELFDGANRGNADAGQPRSDSSQELFDINII